jgi:sterol desaturase/sphingolipid hydroxylase (fatty acid hydroxylase superfamily)
MTWEEFNAVWLWRVSVAGFIVVAGWETLVPRMTLLMPAPRRWRANFGLYGLLALSSYLVVGTGMVGAAQFAQTQNWGLLKHAWIPFWFQWIVGYLLYDFSDYWAHRSSHEIRPLWRIHHVHHSDPDCDVTTSLRFHPLEYLFGQACSVLLVLVFAPPVSAVMASLVTFSIVSMVTHANARIPERLDRVLRYVFITPDTHRTHHSADVWLQFGNYATVFSFWDRLWGTYIQPRHDMDTFGLPEVDPDRAIELSRMLIDPFTASLRDVTEPSRSGDERVSDKEAVTHP